MARSITIARIGERDDQVRARFKFPPVDQGRTIVRRTNEPNAPAKEGAYLVFLENGWLDAIEVFEGKSDQQTWSRTAVPNWTSNTIPPQEVENIRMEHGMARTYPG